MILRYPLIDPALEFVTHGWVKLSLCRLISMAHCTLHSIYNINTNILLIIFGSHFCCTDKKKVLVVIVGKGYTFIVYRNLVKFKTYMIYNSTVS